MIDPEELAICRKRGHRADNHMDGKWAPCQHCRMWIRWVRNKEEREDQPPDEDIDPFWKLGLEQMRK